MNVFVLMIDILGYLFWFYGVGVTKPGASADSHFSHIKLGEF